MNTAMPQIRNVVHLMLENRSLDNLLGWLYANDAPLHFYPPGNNAPYDGLATAKYSNPAYSEGVVVNYPVRPIAPANQGLAVPYYDPYEAMSEDSGFDGTWNGVMNQLFGDQNIIAGMPTPGATPAMMGFLQDYYSDSMIDWQGLDILWTYPPAQAPVINGLAATYAVSDRWFCSVPTQTNPNRAYSLCGTSIGREANSSWTAVEQYDIPTLFNALGIAGKSWGLYYEDIWHSNQCYTQYTFPRISSAPNGEIAAMAQFFTHAQAGSLPGFTYLEPKWGYGVSYLSSVQGHDYHPPTLIGPGENFLFKVYAALRNSPQWENLLFVVTFDEHGGTYDHVAPGWNAINPDGIIGTRWGFDFELYGVRVPTLLISPFVPRGTVFREPAKSAHPYDHTSFIATLLRWAGVDPARAGLGARVAAAPTFDGVLSSTPVNDAPLPAMPPESTAQSPRREDELFAGIPFACVRAILQRSGSAEEVHARVACYRRDPRGFEAAIGDGRMPEVSDDLG